MAKFQVGQFVKYSDGEKGRVIDVNERQVTVRLTDGTDAHLHPLDAEEALTVLPKRAPSP